MPDIFLSYNREDQATARCFAEAFAAEGLEVWWDTTLRAGEAYDQVTEKALKTAKAVVVLWSKQSVESRWVRAEATLADRNKTLVPVTIEPCERPIMFELTQTAELSHWHGEPADRAWLAFLADLKRFVQSGAMASAPALTAAPAPRQSEKLSICVLPFANMSADAEQEYFADGITEDIITDLSKVSALSVIARNTAFTFKGKSVEVPQVARQLGVTHVLEGSVRKAGARVRITAQLIDGKAGDHLWAERWDRDLEDIFALQDEISEAIVGALKLKLFPEEKKAIEGRATTDFETYDKFLRARAISNNLGGPDDITLAARLLHDVLAIDPEFAPARGVLATTYALMLIFMPEAKQEALRALEKTVQEALEKAPGHWASHLANAILLDQRRDWLAADVAYVEARALAPPSEVAVPSFSSLFLSSVGRNTDALDVLLAARNLDPLATAISTPLQQCLDLAGRPAEAQAEYERTRDLPGGHEIPEHQAAMRLWETGDLAAIKAQARRFFESQAVPMPVLNAVYEVFDQPEAALAHLHSAIDDPAYQDSTRQFILALYAAHFGDQALALTALRRAYVDLQGLQPQILWYPVLRQARRTPAFKQLVFELGLYDYWSRSGHWSDFARPVGDDDFEIIG